MGNKGTEDKSIVRYNLRTRRARPTPIYVPVPLKNKYPSGRRKVQKHSNRDSSSESDSK